MEKGRKKPFYSDLLKRTVLHRMWAEQISFEEISRLYGIGGSCTVRNWAKKWRDLLPNEPSAMPDLTKKQAGEKKKSRQTRQRTDDQRRISELEAQLLEARQRAELYAIALDLVRQEVGEDVLKKTGETLSRQQRAADG